MGKTILENEAAKHFGRYYYVEKDLGVDPEKYQFIGIDHQKEDTAILRNLKTGFNVNTQLEPIINWYKKQDAETKENTRNPYLNRIKK